LVFEITISIKLRIVTDTVEHVAALFLNVDAIRRDQKSLRRAYSTGRLEIYRLIIADLALLAKKADVSMASCP
jgi:hypothetical protein